MTKVAVKGLLGRKVRTFLTGFAIVLGVAMVAGTLVSTDTVQKAFDNVFSSAYDDTSVSISGKRIVDGSVNAPTVPASLVPKVRRLDGVEAAAGGFLFKDVRLVGRSGDDIARHAPGFGFGLDPTQPQFSPLMLAAGRWAAGPREVVIDRRTATRLHYAIGDRIGAKADGPVEQYRITGLATVAGASIGAATVAAFDVPTAQAVLNKPGQVDGISVSAQPGVPASRLADEIRPLLPPSAEVKTAAQEVEDASKDVTSGTNTVRVFLLTFAVIALFVGSFVIFNTISITVAQRTRELATLRTLGASRRQVLRSVLLESALIGVAASALGLLGGIGLAKGLTALFKALGATLPDTSMVVAGRTIWVSLLTGTLVTVLAGLFPALRATRVPPISAVREGAIVEAHHHPRVRAVSTVIILLVAAVLLANGLRGGDDVTAVLVSLGAGTLLLFLAAGMLAGQVVKPLARVVGWPARRLGGQAGKLAAENAVRHPGRTAGSAAALMIGLALVTFVATLGQGIKHSVRDALDQQIKSGYVVTASEDADVGTFSAASLPAWPPRRRAGQPTTRASGFTT